MSNPTKSTWEQAIVNKMTANGERLAVVEKRLESIEKQLGNVEKTTQKIESLLGWLKWIGGGIVAILISIIANFIYSLVA